jgi:hypothetical protein
LVKAKLSRHALFGTLAEVPFGQVAAAVAAGESKETR